MNENGKYYDQIRNYDLFCGFHALLRARYPLEGANGIVAPEFHA